MVVALPKIVFLQLLSRLLENLRPTIQTNHTCGFRKCGIVLYNPNIGIQTAPNYSFQEIRCTVGKCMLDRIDVMSSGTSIANKNKDIFVEIVKILVV